MDIHEDPLFDRFTKRQKDSDNAKRVWPGHKRDAAITIRRKQERRRKMQARRGLRK